MQLLFHYQVSFIRLGTISRFWCCFLSIDFNGSLEEAPLKRYTEKNNHSTFNELTFALLQPADPAPI